MSKFKFEKIGLMIDLSHNAVISLEALNRLLPLLAKMGYNTLYLYTDENQGNSPLDYMRGHYSPGEMREIAVLCDSFSIQAIPCNKEPDDACFCGALCGWTGLIPHNAYSIGQIKPTIDACKQNKTSNIFFCLWGGKSPACSYFAQLPALHCLAMYAKGVTDEEKIQAKFKTLIGIAYDDFIAIDRVNFIAGNEETSKEPCNPSRCFLYSDTFGSEFDYNVAEGHGKSCAVIAEQLHNTAKQSRKYGYVLESAACLSDVLTLKYELGVRTRKAYQSGDRETLRALADHEYTVLPGLVKKFTAAFEKQWMRDNRSYGFDLHEIRLAGVKAGLEARRNRLCDYLDGKIHRIEELEGEILPFGKKGQSGFESRITSIMTGNIF